MPTKIHIPVHTDKKLISGFRKVLKSKAISSAFHNPQGDILILGSDNVLPISNFWEDSIIDEVLLKNSYIIQRIRVHLGRDYLLIQRGSSQGPEFLGRDVLQFEKSNPNHPGGLKGDLLIVISSECVKEFGQFVSPKGKEADLFGILTSRISDHETLISKLETTLTNIAEDTNKHRERLDLEYEEKRKSLESNYVARIEKEENQLNEAYESQKKSLDEKDERLREKEHELDASDNTTARRKIRQDILTALKERVEEVSLSAGTQKKRNWVYWAMGLLIIVLLGLVILTTWEFNRVLLTKSGISFDVPTFILLIRQLIFSGGTVAAIVFFIKWQNKWQERHADAEFQLKQFQLDMERASWAVETSIDLLVNDLQAPDYLIDRLTQNLFESNTRTSSQVLHPADELASALLGTASGVKLQVGGNELELNTKKVNKLGKVEMN